MTTPHQHLTVITTHWGDLEDALPNTTPGTAYGIGLRAYLDHLVSAERPTVEELREARGWQRAGTHSIGERPVPISLRVHDTMRAVERALLATADHIAHQVQRAPLTVDTGRGWTDATHREAALLAARDAADPARWSYTNPKSRTAPLAAVWLQHRLDGAPGPFRALHIQQHDRIRTVAAGAAQRVLAALDMARRTQTAPQPCPHCRGTLRIEGGDGRPPSVRCRDCGWARSAEAADAA